MALSDPTTSDRVRQPATLPPWKRRLVLGTATAAGLGYAPVAPGTFGTLAALPLWWLLYRHGASVTTWALTTGAVVVVAVWAARAAESLLGTHDARMIVIDEVAGMLCTAVCVPFRWHEVVTAFLVFRALDVVKPYPIRWLDRNLRGGFGVVIDDVVAGAVGAVLMHTTRAVLGGWW